MTRTIKNQSLRQTYENYDQNNNNFQRNFLFKNSCQSPRQTFVYIALQKYLGRDNSIKIFQEATFYLQTPVNFHDKLK